MTGFLETLGSLVGQNLWVGLLIALLAGVLTSFTPCSLSTFPLVLAYTGGYSENRRRAVFHSLMFCLGMTLVFVIIGLITALLGQTMLFANSIWYMLLGALMTAMAFQLWGVINILPKKCGATPSKRKGALGALLTGILSAVFASPCATPVLVAILAVVSTGQSIAGGVFMLLAYAVGQSVVLVFAGTFVGFIKQLGGSEKFAKVAKVLSVITGLLVFALALYLFYSAFA